MTPRRHSFGAAAESSFPLCRAFAIIWYEIVTMLGLVGGLPAGETCSRVG